MKRPSTLYFIVLLSGLSSCVSHESLLNYNRAPYPDIPQQAIDNYRPLVIQVNDILQIQLSSPDALAAQPFQLGGGRTAANANNVGGMLTSGFLVNRAGEITYPTIGNLRVVGHTLEEAKAIMLAAVRPYFNTDPIINIRLLNFNVSVNGEVNRPGSFSVPNERLTVLEAITQAGDFTDYAARDSVMVIRETAGARTFAYLNFNSPEVFQSPCFYLQQNDVVYVRPLRRKVLTVQDPVRRGLTYLSAATGVGLLIVAISRN